MGFKEYINEKVVNEDYKSDTAKYIESVLKNVDDKGAKKFLEGLKKFVKDNGFLTDDQRKGLAAFNAPAQDAKKK